MNKFLEILKDFFKKFFFVEKWKENKKKWPSKKQWRSFLKIVSTPERILFVILIITTVLSGFFWWRFSFIEKTKVVAKEGGSMKEVIVGEPQNLNPLFAPLNDADKDVSELIYASLLKYDRNGDLKNDLVEKYTISPDGKIYTFTLKNKIFWSDGTKITVDDVLFTMETIQNPEVQSPLRITFQGLKMEKIDERNIKFSLDKAYPSFVENFDLKIIPKHIFQEVNPQELFSFIPEKSVNSGPFKVLQTIKEGEKITKIILGANEKYHNGKPFIQKMEIIFKETKEDTLSLKSKVTNIGEIPPEEKKNLEKAFNIYSLYSPRYFALFLNQGKTPLNQREVREAMALATPKEEIIEKVFYDQARKVDAPFLEENKIEGKYAIYNYDVRKAQRLLEKNGWKDTDKNGFREKTINGKTMVLRFTIYTVEQKELNAAAELIKNSWKKAGISVDIKTYPPQDLLQSVIKERKYSILLFGHTLMMTPEPYSFWHSSQIKYPGLNLSLYKNEKVDSLLELAREQKDINKRRKILADAQQKITTDIPAIFLYSPNFLYAIRKQIKGSDGKYIVNPSKRFIDIEKWHIKTKRVPKKAPKKEEIKTELKESPSPSPKKK